MLNALDHGLLIFGSSTRRVQKGIHKESLQAECEDNRTIYMEYCTVVLREILLYRLVPETLNGNRKIVE